MEKYDYREAMCEDIRQYIADNNIKVTSENKDEVYEKLNEDLWIADSVTGNGSGSYTFSTWKAEEYLCHNLDLLLEAMREFGCEPKDFKGAEWGDVAIRCYLLGECLSRVLNEMTEEE